MRILLTGRTGQVGSALERALAPLGDLVAFDRKGLDLQFIGNAISKAKPDIIVNAAAYTAVDRAEQEKELAFAVNAAAVGELASQAKAIDALLVHFSTDFVYDGEKPAPYVETDAPNPLNVYGQSKLEGERAIAASGCRHVVFRTSWVYSPGGRNFMLAILAAAKTKPELRVVDDQRGAPTSSRQLARAVRDLFTPGDGGRPIEGADVARVKESSGLYHASAAGETTWFGFAGAIFAARERAGKGAAPRLIAIPTRDYPLPARRPAYSLLSNGKLAADLGVRIPAWREGLDEALSGVR